MDIAQVAIDFKSIDFKYREIAANIAVALASGLLVGLEREWAQKEIGVRTFSITALMGALATMIAPSMIIGALVGVLLLVVFLNVHSLLKDRSLELTTSIALIVVVILGALAGQGHYFEAACSAILITMLLAWKLELAKFADALTPEEIRGAVLLGLLCFVIYPLLKDEYIDPYQLINPRRAWVTVVVIAGIGFINYVLLRLYSTRGLYYGALLGGLVNSTAAVAELSAAFSGKPQHASRAIAVLLITNVAMFLRNIVILAIFARFAVATAFGPLAVMAASSLIFAWMRVGRDKNPGESIRLESPVSLPRVLKFGVIFLVISATASLAQRNFNQEGFLVVAVLGGLISSASTTAAAASLAAAGQISPTAAGMATVLTSMSSAVVNIPLVYQQTRQAVLTRSIASISTAVILLGLVAMGTEWLVRNEYLVRP